MQDLPLRIDPAGPFRFRARKVPEFVIGGFLDPYSRIRKFRLFDKGFRVFSVPVEKDRRRQAQVQIGAIYKSSRRSV